MKILLLALIPIAILPFMSSESSKAMPTTGQTSATPQADEPVPRWLTADESAAMDTPCDCLMTQTPIKGVIDKIRANNCYVLDSPCDSPTVKVIVQGTIPGAPQVGDKVAICGTLNLNICNTSYNGYDIQSAAIITDCDDCP